MVMLFMHLISQHELSSDHNPFHIHIYFSFVNAFGAEKLAASIQYGICQHLELITSFECAEAVFIEKLNQGNKLFISCHPGLVKASVCNFYHNFNIHTLRCDLLYIHDEKVHRLASSP